MSISETLEKLRDNSPRSIYHFILSKTAKASQKFDQNTPCIFVLSTGRTGTETLAHILNLSRDLFAYHEPTPYLYPLSKIAYEQESQIKDGSDYGRLFTSSLKSMREGLWNESLSCGRGYAETSPQVTFLASLLGKMIPEARFIHLVRHPMHVIRSGMRRGWFSGHPYDEYRITPKLDSPFAENWLNYSALEKNAWLWAETNHWISNFIQTLPVNLSFTLSSESIFRKDERLIQMLFDFLHIIKPSANSIRGAIARKYNRQESGDFQFEPDWLDSMDHDVSKFLRDISGHFEYELTPNNT